MFLARADPPGHPRPRRRGSPAGRRALAAPGVVLPVHPRRAAGGLLHRAQLQGAAQGGEWAAGGCGWGPGVGASRGWGLRVRAGMEEWRWRSFGCQRAVVFAIPNTEGDAAAWRPSVYVDGWARWLGGSAAGEPSESGTRRRNGRGTWQHLRWNYSATGRQEGGRAGECVSGKQATSASWQVQRRIGRGLCMGCGHTISEVPVSGPAGRRVVAGGWASVPVSGARRVHTRSPMPQDAAPLTSASTGAAAWAAGRQAGVWGACAPTCCAPAPARLGRHSPRPAAVTPAPGSPHMSSTRIVASSTYHCSTRPHRAGHGSLPLCRATTSLIAYGLPTP